MRGKKKPTKQQQQQQQGDLKNSHKGCILTVNSSGNNRNIKKEKISNCGKKCE